jgi:hypothetical protein
MQNDISFFMQEEMKPRIKYRRQGKKSYLAWRRRCIAVLAALLAVLRWRPVEVSWLTDGSSKRSGAAVSSGGEVTALPLSFSVLFFSFFVLPTLLFVSLSNTPLFQTRLLSPPLSLSFSLSLVCFPFLFLPFIFFSSPSSPFVTGVGWYL